MVDNKLRTHLKNAQTKKKNSYFKKKYLTGENSTTG